ncbi:hypothetical protein SRHO_G00291190 [Serrasalmus rhombeus]
MPREDRATWKSNYFLKITQLLNDYLKCFIVGADNVDSKQMQTIRLDLLLANKVPAAARAGAIAPCEISRGTIEVLSNVQLIKPGDKVGASEATLLNMLNISPYSYGLIIQQVYDNGSVYSPEVLDITEDALHKRFLEGVRNIAGVCLQIGYPTLASIPHSIINGYKRVLTVAVETDYSFPLAYKVKAFLADPSAFAAVAAPVAAAAPAAEPAKDESEDMGFGLLRPDLVLWSNSCRRVYIIELTVPWEEAIDEAYERKRLRYSNLAAQAEERGWTMLVCPVELGCRGFVANSTIRLLKEVGIRGQAQRRTIKELATTAERNSHWLWLQRKEMAWGAK